MNCYNKNKNELLTLTGAVYSFVAYLTAFTLEILFMIDLAKRTSGLVAISTGTTSSASSSSSPDTSNSTPLSKAYDEDPSQQVSTNTFEQARLALESMQTHVTISCLAISILYFVLFVASLVLIVALILRSTFFILIWMCIMTTMYLPEFGLIIYVSIYGWGLETRNGQTELLFYLFRAALNVIFIFRAHKLFKEWSNEKNFFMLKSGNRFTGYDSPYFIGDSLTTTINPVFSSSTLHLDRYDQVRDIQNSPATISNFFPNQEFQQHHRMNVDRSRKASSLYVHENNERTRPTFGHPSVASGKGFYLGSSPRHEESPQQVMKIGRTQMPPNNSMLSINDDYDEFEMDLDYRTLTHQHHYQPTNESSSRKHNVTGDHQQRLTHLDGTNQNRSPGAMSYSTQSLDRRHFRDLDFGMPEQVTLRPLGHQPFEYLHRPGSSSNLNLINNINTQPTAHPTSKKSAKLEGSSLNDRYC